MIAALFTDLLPSGGVQTASRELAAALCAHAGEHNTNCLFLSLNDPAGDHDLRVADQRITFRGFSAHKTRFAIAALRLAGRQPALILAAHPHLAVLGAAITLFSPRTRFVAVAHGIEIWQPLPFLRRWGLHRADLLLGPSSDTVGKLINVQRLPATRVRHVPWAVPPDFAELAKPGLQPPANLPAGPVILTVGRWTAAERYKGLDLLIRCLPSVLQAVPNAYLIAVGHGDDRPYFEKLAVQMGVQPRVIFVNSPSRAQLMAWYAHCEIFAMPSRGEGFGLVFLEAMSLGKAVVGGAHGGTPDIIQHGVNGWLVEHGDLEALRLALIALLTNDKLRQSLGNAARHRVDGQFQFPNFRSRLDEVLQELRPGQPRRQIRDAHSDGESSVLPLSR